MLFSLLTTIGLAAAAPQRRDDPRTLTSGPDHAANYPRDDATTTNSTNAYYLEFQYSQNFITVGDLDIFAAIWQTGFSYSDALGIDTDNSYTQYGYEDTCIYSDSKPDLQVQVKMNGKWGNIDTVSGENVRSQMIIGMWDMVQKIWEEDGQVWNQCASEVYGMSDNTSAVCGTFRPTQCDCKKGGDGSYNADLCFGKTQAYKIPSEMELNVYNADGSLRADTMSVAVTSQQIVPSANGCGKLGAFAEVYLGLIPELGKAFSDQVKIMCRAS